ncbi:MAG: Hsp70 family protein, partial [SAR324 cluster bacterium]|nr:Hsp70 family protein [SAR324 cluster bacterium]
MSETIIGIDLGTTNSLAALVNEDGPEIIGPPENPCMIPSLLSRNGSRWLVGEEAREHLIASPANSVYSVKRLMGRGFEELEEEIRELPYQVEEAQRKLVKIRIG